MSDTFLDHAQFIDRDAINTLTFPAEDVLPNREAMMKRSRQIHRATSLGNLEQRKVHIFFKDTDSIKCIHTTIWVQLGTHILLKGRIKLPVHRILSVKID